MTFLKNSNQFMKVHGTEWKNCVGVCSDGARAMKGKHNGVVAQIKEVAPDDKFVYCSIHREALAARKMPAVLKRVLTEAVKFVNFINPEQRIQDYFRFYVRKWAASMINFFIPKLGGCYGGMC
jgi:hypothetical protein